jgi:cytochrome c oxidase subunit 3
MSTEAAMRIASQFDSAEQQREAATFGMWIFLATELMFFGPLFFGYLYGRTHFGEAFGAASRHTDIALGTINTAVLLTSSAAIASAAAARRLGATRLATRLLFVTAALGALFLVLKGIEYRHEWQEHLVPGLRFSFAPQYIDGAEIFFFLYFVLTGLHAVHLCAGIVLTVFFALHLRRGNLLFANEEKIEIAALYWHFVDVVWIFLYPMLYLIERAGG